MNSQRGDRFLAIAHLLGGIWQACRSTQTWFEFDYWWGGDSQLELLPQEAEALVRQPGETFLEVSNPSELRSLAYLIAEPSERDALPLAVWRTGRQSFLDLFPCPCWGPYELRALAWNDFELANKILEASQGNTKSPRVQEEQVVPGSNRHRRVSLAGLEREDTMRRHLADMGSCSLERLENLALHWTDYSIRRWAAGQMLLAAFPLPKPVTDTTPTNLLEAGKVPLALRLLAESDLPPLKEWHQHHEAWGFSRARFGRSLPDYLADLEWEFCTLTGAECVGLVGALACTRYDSFRGDALCSIIDHFPRTVDFLISINSLQARALWIWLENGSDPDVEPITEACRILAELQ